MTQSESPSALYSNMESTIEEYYYAVYTEAVIIVIKTCVL